MLNLLGLSEVKLSHEANMIKVRYIKYKQINTKYIGSVLVLSLLNSLSSHWSSWRHTSSEAVSAGHEGGGLSRIYF